MAVLPLSLALSLLFSLVFANVITDPVQFTKQYYDFVVVGGGTAGLAVAARLAENHKYTVGVIEAGKYRPGDPLIEVPNDIGATLFNKDYDWGYVTAPQKHVQNKGLAYARGKVLGGTSAINFMAFLRASKKEYDAWSKIAGSSWNWDTLLPFFKKSQNFKRNVPNFPDSAATFVQDLSDTPSGEFNGHHGPVKVSFNAFRTSVDMPFVEAAHTAGMIVNAAPDFGVASGIVDGAQNVDLATGIRSYSANSYLNPNQSNLVVLTEAQATQILFSSKLRANGELFAYGVKFVSNGATYTVHAHKEVIISGGVINTPQLLELSGIGNKNILNKYGIKTLVNLPGVGENFQDHMYTFADWEIESNATTFDTIRNSATLSQEAASQYAKNHTGPLATGVSVYGFIPLQYAVTAARFKSLVKQLESQLKSINASPIQKAQFELQKGFVNDFKIGDVELILYPAGGFATVPPKPNTNYATVINAISHPFSRGSIHIASSDPLTAPTIDPNLFQVTFDKDLLIEVFRLSRHIMASEPIKHMVVRPSTPDSSVDTWAEWEQYVLATVQPNYHGIGTAILAPKSMGGVVNEELIVYGTTNLRVADASVIPIHMASHPTSTIYAIAERAAHMILSSH